MIDIILDHLPWFWLGVAVFCILIEACTFALTTVWPALAAFVMIFVSVLPIPFRWQLLIFALASLALVIFTRPIAIKKLKVKIEPTNSDALVGKKVLVTKKITELEKGTVKINGVEWSATCASEADFPIEKGEEVVVQSIQGATVSVARITSNQ